MFYTCQVFRDGEGEIEGYKCLMRSLQPRGFSHAECVFIESDLVIDPDYVLVTEEDGQLVVSENTTVKNQEAEIALRVKRIQFGQRLIAIMGIRNDAKSLTVEQLMTLVSTFAGINTAWMNGMIASSRSLIDALTPDGTLLTEDDKTAILAEIDANWVALGYPVEE